MSGHWAPLCGLAQHHSPGCHCQGPECSPAFAVAGALASLLLLLLPSIVHAEVRRAMERLGQGMAAVPAPVWPHLVGRFAAPGRAAMFAILAWGVLDPPHAGCMATAGGNGGTGVMGRGK